MSEPTLEQIAEREIIALREATDERVTKLEGALLLGAHATNKRLDSHNHVMESIVHRVRALEQQARPEQEDGHLAGSWCDHGFRREDDPQWRLGMAQCAQCAAVDWKARAETAERERDEWKSTWQNSPLEGERDAALAKVERLTAALGIARFALKVLLEQPNPMRNPDGEDDYVRLTCKDALAATDTAALEDA